VPTCGNWTLADLIWHLAEVQDFWAYIITTRPAGPEHFPIPQRPADDQLADLLDERNRQLVESLQHAHPTDQAWSWASEQTVAFSLRRQTHEAVVHHADGALAVGHQLPTLDPTIAADGIDELVTVMLSGVPDWATFRPGSETIQLTTRDTDDTWNLRCGRMTGTSPGSGTEYDLSAFELLDRLDAPSTIVSADSLDLLLWLWGRCKTDRLTTTGDPDGIGRLRTAVAEATQ
jgi:uncharacterized protein (TIGR03083 family)